MEKHLPYFKLLDSFNAEECPLCRRASEAVERYFSGLLYERVNDVGFRRRFNAGDSFCRSHAYAFARYHDGLAVCLVYQEPLRSSVERLLNPRKEDRKRLPAQGGVCPVCAHVEEVERVSVATVAHHLTDRELKERFFAFEALCIPHFSAVRAACRDLPAWFTELHAARYDDLLRRVKTFLDGCNYSLGEKRPALEREDELVYQKVVKTLYGYEGSGHRYR